MTWGHEHMCVCVSGPHLPLAGWGLYTLAAMARSCCNACLLAAMARFVCNCPGLLSLAAWTDPSWLFEDQSITLLFQPSWLFEDQSITLLFQHSSLDLCEEELIETVVAVASLVHRCCRHNVSDLLPSFYRVPGEPSLPLRFVWCSCCSLMLFSTLLPWQIFHWGFISVRRLWRMVPRISCMTS